MKYQEVKYGQDINRSEEKNCDVIEITIKNNIYRICEKNGVLQINTDKQIAVVPRASNDIEIDLK